MKLAETWGQLQRRPSIKCGQWENKPIPDPWTNLVYFTNLPLNSCQCFLPGQFHVYTLKIARRSRGSTLGLIAFLCSARGRSAEHRTSNVTLEMSNWLKICRSSFWSFFFTPPPPLYATSYGFCCPSLFTVHLWEKTVGKPSYLVSAKTVEAFYSFSRYCIFQTVCERQQSMAELFRRAGDKG